MAELVKVFLACFVGAFFASLLFLEHAPAYWWLGVLCSGLISYVVVVLGVFFSDIVHGRQSSRPHFSHASLVRILIVAGWVSWWFIAYLFMTMVIVPSDMAMRVLVISAPVMFLVGCVHALLIKDRDLYWYYPALMKGVLRYAWVFPIIMLGYYLPVGIWRGVSFMVTFVKHELLSLYADRKLLCFTFAALGGLVGLFMNNPLMGGIGGGLVAAVSYQLVSQRWLRPRGLLK